MTVYYVDADLSSGNNDGGGDGTLDDPTDPNNWTDAWQSIATAITAGPAAGDKIYCKGTEQAGATVTFPDTLVGTIDAYIEWIGCPTDIDSTGSIGDSRFQIDGQSGSYHTVTMSGADYNLFTNFTFKNAGTSKHGISETATYSEYNIFVNCRFTNNGTYGIYISYQRYYQFYSCLFDSNTTGVRPGTSNTQFFHCRFADNTTYGADSYAEVLYGCIFEGNSIGYRGYNHTTMINCIFNNNSTRGIEIYGGRIRLIECRFTNNGSAFNTTSGYQIWLYHTYVEGSISNGYYRNIHTSEMVDTNVLSGTDSSGGYITGTLNLAPTATLRSVPVELP